MRARITEVPDGTYRWEDVLDDDGISAIAHRDPRRRHGQRLRRGRRLHRHRSAGARPDQLHDRHDARRRVLRAVAALDPHIPKNYGCYAPIRVIAPEGTIVHPRPPAPVVGRMEIGPPHRRCAARLPRPGRARQGDGAVLWLHQPHHHLRRGRGRAARHGSPSRSSPAAGAAVPASTATTAGRPTCTTCRTCPSRSRRRPTRCASSATSCSPSPAAPAARAAAWASAGSCGCSWPTGHLTMHCDRVRFPAPGMLGGGPGGAARCVSSTRHAGSARGRLQGDRRAPRIAAIVVRFDSQGGGGYGPPAERAPAAVARDLADGKLSRDAARRLFGHVLEDQRGAVAS